MTASNPSGRIELRRKAEVELTLARPPKFSLQAEYGMLIFGVWVGTTNAGRAHRKDVDPQVVAEMLAKAGGGKIPLHPLLRKRVRHFSAGLMFGKGDGCHTQRPRPE